MFSGATLLHAVGLIESGSMLKAVFLFMMPFLAAAMPVFAMDAKDVAYASRDGKPLLLDFHIPDGQGPFPAAVLIHGGGFDG